MWMTCQNCGGSYLISDGPVGVGYSKIRFCKCGNRSASATNRIDRDEVFFESGPVGGMSPQRAQERSYARSYSQYQAPVFQSQSSSTDTVPLSIGIGIGVILGIVICLGFVAVF